MLVLDFQSQQMRLLIPLAKTYAYHFACEKALNMYASRTPATMKDVHAVCAGLKSVTTWHKSDTLQVCRECCGGQGFSSHNKIGVMKSDSDVEQTYEGDNGVCCVCCSLPVTSVSSRGGFWLGGMEQLFSCSRLLAWS